MVRLNTQSQQFGWFTPGRRGIGRTPKMPIGAVANPHLPDFANPNESPAAKTHHLLGIIRRIRQASTAADFNGKLDSR